MFTWCPAGHRRGERKYQGAAEPHRPEARRSRWRTYQGAQAIPSPCKAQQTSRPWLCWFAPQNAAVSASEHRELRVQCYSAKTFWIAFWAIFNASLWVWLTRAKIKRQDVFYGFSGVVRGRIVIGSINFVDSYSVIMNDHIRRFVGVYILLI